MKTRIFSYKIENHLIKEIQIRDNIITLYYRPDGGDYSAFYGRLLNWVVRAITRKPVSYIEKHEVDHCYLHNLKKQISSLHTHLDAGKVITPADLKAILIEIDQRLSDLNDSDVPPLLSTQQILNSFKLFYNELNSQPSNMSIEVYEEYQISLSQPQCPQLLQTAASVQPIAQLSSASNIHLNSVPTVLYLAMMTMGIGIFILALLYIINRLSQKNSVNRPLTSIYNDTNSATKSNQHDNSSQKLADRFKK